MSRTAALVLALLAAGAAGAETWAVGDRIAPFTLEDQHGEIREVDEDVAMILFSRDMDGGDLLKAAVGEGGDDFLERNRAVYVADISGMPRLIARFFAIPSMRKRPYAMLLDRDGEATANLPDEEGFATVIHLEALRVTSITHVDSAEGVRSAVESPSGDAPR